MYKKYNIYIAAIAKAGIAILIAMAFYLKPLSGDLTRLGGFSENSFGWKTPQERFPYPLFERDNYHRYHDVVVFGDSFSYKSTSGKEQTDIGTYWQNYLVNETGLSLVTFNVNKVDLFQIVSSPVFKKAPPKVVILELVERDIIYTVKKITKKIPDKAPDNKRPVKLQAQALSCKPLNLRPIKISRSDLLIQDDNNLIQKLGYSGNFLKKYFMRNFLHINVTKVKRLQLTQNNLFSSKDNSSLLIYDVELDKFRWKEKQITKTRHRLKKLQDFIESNNKTFFSFFIAPDRTTAYSEFLTDKYSALPKADLFIDKSLHFIRVHKNICHATKACIPDIYYPNDTHWGYRGHQIAASSVRMYLVENRLLKHGTASRQISRQGW